MRTRIGRRTQTPRPLDAPSRVTFYRRERSVSLRAPFGLSVLNLRRVIYLGTTQFS